jgi:drug/metabolite transporter (DMT)-like permease
MSLRASLWLLLLAAIWGSSYLFITIALGSVGPAFVAFARTAGAALLLAPVLWRRRAALTGRWHFVPVVAAFQMAIPLMLISMGEQTVDSGLTGILIASQPMWLVILPAASGQGRPRLMSLAGIAVGLAGVAVLLGGPGVGAHLRGAGLIVGAAVSYAVGVLVVRRLMPGVDAIALTAANVTAAAMLVAPFALADLPTAAPSTAGLGALIVLAVVCTAAGFLIYNRLIVTASGQFASLVAFLSPPFAVGYGALVLGEPVGPASVLGLVLVLAGSWLCARPARSVMVRGAERDATVARSGALTGYRYRVAPPSG